MLGFFELAEGVNFERLVFLAHLIVSKLSENGLLKFEMLFDLLELVVDLHPHLKANFEFENLEHLLRNDLMVSKSCPFLTLDSKAPCVTLN